MSVEELADLISSELRRSPSIEIEGLGRFRRDRKGRITFTRGNRPRIFVAYALEDAALAEKLFTELHARGYAPWLDRKKLLPGQNWPRRIQDAIESCDFFIACFSTKSVNKRGGFQAEIRYALDCATRVPLDEVFLIPVRLDDCRVPSRIRRETQYIDLFPDWRSGVERVIGVIERHGSG